MFARVLLVSDLHKRQTDFTSIGNYTKAVDKVQLDILKFIRENNITHFVSLGDWYDKGYSNTARTLSDRNFDEEIARAVNGNAYICIGNHLFLERDNNPEFYLIQPHEQYKPRDNFVAFTPTFKAVRDIQIGGLQISLFHYSKENKNYHNTRRPETKFHVGIYHDDCVVPSSVRQKAGFLAATSSNLNHMYDNIDLAVVGHIHTPIGLCQLNLGDRILPLVVPGSLSITKNSQYEKHASVNLPVIEVNDAGEINTRFVSFSTHMDELVFYEKKESLRPSKEIHEGNALDTIITPSGYYSLSKYLQEHKHQKAYIDMVQQLGHDTLDRDILDIVKEVHSCD